MSGITVEFLPQQVEEINSLISLNKAKIPLDILSESYDHIFYSRLCTCVGYKILSEDSILNGSSIKISSPGSFAGFDYFYKFENRIYLIHIGQNPYVYYEVNDELVSEIDKFISEKLDKNGKKRTIQEWIDYFKNHDTTIIDEKCIDPASDAGENFINYILDTVLKFIESFKKTITDIYDKSVKILDDIDPR